MKSWIALWKQMRPYLSRYRWGLGALCFSLFSYTAIGRVIPSLIGDTIDRLVHTHSGQALTQFCGIYLGLELLKFALDVVKSVLFQWIGQKIIFDLRSDTFKRVQRLPVSYFDNTPVGKVVTRLTNDFVSLSDLFTAGLLSFISDALSLLFIVAALFLLNERLSLYVLSIMPMVILTCYWLSKKAKGVMHLQKRLLARINSFLAENIHGIQLIQLYNRQSRNQSQFNKLSEEYREHQISNLRFLAWLGPILSSFNMISLTLALLLGGMLYQQKGIGLGTLIAFLFHIQDIFQPLRNILEKYQSFQNSLTSGERIFSLLREKEESYDGAALPKERLKGHVRFDQVSFAYNDLVGPILRNVSFAVDPGQSLAIVGATGSGKSSLIGLLQRFHEPQRGSIFVDGQDIGRIHKSQLRRRIGVVQQDQVVFQGTLASNVSLNDPSIGWHRIEEAFSRAQCQGLLRRHLRGLDAPVSERGADLSAGERQLLALARVLAFDPDILVLDEATAHIDPETELLIQHATQEAMKGRTSIVIAHRLSMIIDCDKILVLDNGSIREIGSHRELIEQNGFYRKLHDLQAKIGPERGLAHHASPGWVR